MKEKLKKTKEKIILNLHEEKQLSTPEEKTMKTKHSVFVLSFIEWRKTAKRWWLKTSFILVEKKDEPWVEEKSVL